MSKTSILLLTSVFIFFFHIELLAQDLNEYKKLFPDNDAICLRQSEEIKAVQINGQLVVKGKNKMEFLCLNDLANQYTEQSLPFNQFIKITNPSANVSYPNPISRQDRNVFTVSKFDVVDKLSSNIFYSDAKEIHFKLPKLIKGCIVRIEYEIEYADPHLLTKYYFSNIMPVVESSFKLISDTSVRMQALQFNMKNLSVTYDTIIKENLKIVTLSAQNLNEYAIEPGGPSISYNEPHIIVAIQEYFSNEKWIKLNNGITALYNWYYSLAKNAFHSEVNEELKMLVTKLKSQSLNKEELLSNIYNWVNKNIKYVAFEYGYAGFIPRLPSEVIQKRYGDCKDMSVLLYKLCQLANIKCYPSWIGTQDLPYTYEENPTGYVDNHMILIAEINDSLFALDATAQFLHYTLPSKMIQGKEALMAIDSFQYKIYKIPIVSAEENMIEDSTVFEVDANGIIGKTKIKLCGYSSFDFISSYSYADKSTIHELLNSMFRKVSNKFELIDSSFTYKTKDKVTTVEFTFRVPGCVLQYQNRIFLNMNLGESFRSRIIDTTSRTTDFYLDNTIRYKAYYILNIPKEYKVSYLPANKKIQENVYSFEMVNSQTQNKVISYRNYSFNTLKISRKDINIWNEWIKGIIEVNRENVILEK